MAGLCDGPGKPEEVRQKNEGGQAAIKAPRLLQQLLLIICVSVSVSSSSIGTGTGTGTSAPRSRQVAAQETQPHLLIGVLGLYLEIKAGVLSEVICHVPRAGGLG